MDNFHFSLAEKRKVLSKTGKKREITILCSVDRLLLRMMHQVLYPMISNAFCNNSYAYIEGRGISDAVEQVKTYIKAEESYVAEIDIKDYFDSIEHLRLMELLKQQKIAPDVLNLIEKYLTMKIKTDDKIVTNRRGIIQGSPLSPLLSNLFLNKLDWKMHSEGNNYIRFSDDIKVFTTCYDTAVDKLKEITNFLSELNLQVSDKKCGVFPSISRIYFGYEFIQSQNDIIIQKKSREVTSTQHRWKEARLEWKDDSYHIVSDGILSKRDFSLLFENTEKKMYIPIEVSNVLSIYSDVIFSTLIVLKHFLT
jgi:hypothetical protein